MAISHWGLHHKISNIDTVSLAGIDSEFFWLEFLAFDDIFFQNGEN
jgi:hypothetical protein